MNMIGSCGSDKDINASKALDGCLYDAAHIIGLIWSTYGISGYPSFQCYAFSNSG
jgi:hypothetical protein